jgi:hypothetical protein
MIRRKTGKKAKNVEVNFSEAFNQIKKTLYKKTGDSLKTGFESIVRNTPVKTGYAQTSWRVVFGENSVSIEKKDNDGDYTGLTESVIENGKNIIEEMRKKGFPSRLVFSSPVPYMGRLEYGHSSDKKFFIRQAIAKMKNEISSFKKKGY